MSTWSLPSSQNFWSSVFWAIIKDAMRSPIMIAGEFVLARGQSGMMEMSAMVKPSIPCTQPY